MTHQAYELHEPCLLIDPNCEEVRDRLLLTREQAADRNESLRKRGEPYRWCVEGEGVACS